MPRCSGTPPCSISGRDLREQQRFVEGIDDAGERGATFLAF
jgi:hypothetical protein